MKKYLLTLSLAIFGLIGFSSASYTFTSSSSDWFYFYSPSDITLTNDLEVSVLDYSCSFNTCKIQLDWSEYDENRMMPSCTITYSNWNISLDWTCNFVPQTIETSNPNYDSSAFSSITIWNSSENVWWWDDNNWSDTISQVLPNWFNDLSPAISWIYDVIHQLLPYVVYIWIGVLISVLWFYAIKWLMSYMSWKIRKYFK